MLSCVRLLAIPWSVAFQAPLSSTLFWSLLKFMSIESVVLTISSSVTPFSFCLQSFPASGSLPVSWLFVSGGQSIEASAPEKRLGSSFRNSTSPCVSAEEAFYPQVQFPHLGSSVSLSPSVPILALPNLVFPTGFFPQHENTLESFPSYQCLHTTIF